MRILRNSLSLWLGSTIILFQMKFSMKYVRMYTLQTWMSQFHVTQSSTSRRGRIEHCGCVGTHSSGDHVRPLASCCLDNLKDVSHPFNPYSLHFRAHADESTSPAHAITVKGKDNCVDKDILSSWHSYSAIRRQLTSLPLLRTELRMLCSQ